MAKKMLKAGDYSTDGWLQVIKAEPVSNTVLAVTVRDLQGKGEGRRGRMRLFARKTVDQQFISHTDTIRRFREGDFPAITFYITMSREQDWL